MSEAVLRSDTSNRSCSSSSAYQHAASGSTCTCEPIPTGGRVMPRRRRPSCKVIRILATFPRQRAGGPHGASVASSTTHSGITPIGLATASRARLQRRIALNARHELSGSLSRSWLSIYGNLSNRYLPKEAVLAHISTRKQLYDLVWTGPITTLAKSLLISDVGLAKACRHSDIPLPPRGYWAKLSAGKRVARPPLPPRAPGASNRVEVGSGRPQMFRVDDTRGSDGNDDGMKRESLPPEPPVYDETLDAVEARIRRALPSKFRFLRGLDNAHAQIARLLREDEERREAMVKSRYSFDKPRFESHFEQRRLTFLNNLFVRLARTDVRGFARGPEARELGARVGDQHVKMKVETLASLRSRKRQSNDKKREPMAIEVEVEVARWEHGEREERFLE